MRYSFGSNRTSSVSLASPILLACLLGTGCVADQQDSGAEQSSEMRILTREAPTAADLREDTAYMIRTFRPRPEMSRLGFASVDLSDTRQFNYVIRRLVKTGNTPENSPRLFSSLDRIRKEAVALRAQGGDGLGTAQSALQSLQCGQFIDPIMDIAGGYTNNDAKALVTCFGGTDYVYADLTAYETDDAETYYTEIASDYGEEYAGVNAPAGIDFNDVGTITAMQNDVGKSHLLESLAIATDADGNSSVTFALRKSAAESTPASIALTHPVEGSGGLPIRNCIKRGTFAGNGDCDYAGVDGAGLPSGAPVGIAKMAQIGGVWRADPAPANQWFPWPGFSAAKLYLPLAGTFNAGSLNGACSITGFNAAGTTTVMTLKETGGWCVTSGNASSDIYDNIRTKTGAQTASYNVLGNFGGDCLQNLQAVGVQVTIQANATCNGASRARVAALSPRTIGPIDYRNSCFAEGTGILRADGRYVSVESLSVGDKVLADGRGLALSVVTVSRGGDDHPLVHLYDDKGHDLLLTEKHPVVTTAGILPADKVAVGAEVQTEDGPAVITAVDRVPYKGNVYNLALGTAEELSTIPASNRTMFAGGIRVGDNEMQHEMEIASLKQTREVSAAWSADLANDQARSGKVYLAN
jgi:hypothetical protein